MIQITKLASPEYAGDWHDKPLRWLVTGPGAERQKFSTRAAARRYAKIRRNATSFAMASREYVQKGT